LNPFTSLRGFVKGRLDDFMDERHRRGRRQVSEASQFGELTRRGREYYNRLRWEKSGKRRLG
jgi:hypothetical protein